MENIPQPQPQPQLVTQAEGLSLDEEKSLEASSLCAQGRCAFVHADLVDCGKGKLFGKGNAQLPLAPMLMFDQISDMSNDGGKFERGALTAELTIVSDLWFFACHFYKDPVMPGCLGLDALWQLLGFHLAWLGHKGRGRALGVEDIRFREQVLPSTKLVSYQLHIKRIISGRLVMGIADGVLLADGVVSLTAKGLRVGLFH